MFEYNLNIFLNNILFFGFNKSLLHLAIGRNNYDSVKVLLEFDKIDVNQKTVLTNENSFRYNSNVEWNLIALIINKI